jgi:hypothetical protein
MNKRDIGLHLMGLLALGLTTATEATLIDRGNGLIYDTDQDLTWLQDANYALTSGYATQLGGYLMDGRMRWQEAMDWVDGLNYGGYDDWRLPTVIDTGTIGANQGYSDTDAGYNVDTSASELAYMFHVNLGNKSLYSPDGTRNDVDCALSMPGCFQNTSADGVDILNLQPSVYWSGTDYAPDSVFKWDFYFPTGEQGITASFATFYAWAVREGDVANVTVPEPGTLTLILAGLAGIGATRRRR